MDSKVSNQGLPVVRKLKLQVQLSLDAYLSGMITFNDVESKDDITRSNF